MPANSPITDDMPLFEVTQGAGPLVISAPHVGIHIPADIASNMNATGLKVGETDFHVHRLFDYARALNATTVFATHSRYVVDLNRDPEGHNLYPGKFETPLCPLTDFDLNPLYLQGHEPSPAEQQRRLETYWRPYHRQVRQALDAAVARHGYALLIDAHSIRPSIPTLFEGHLPDLNFGMNDGTSCAGLLTDIVRDWTQDCHAYSHVIDGRFKGGYTTRHYGQPAQRIHAIQIEIVQTAYLDSITPHLYDAGIAAPLSQTLRPLIEALLTALPRVAA